MRPVHPGLSSGYLRGRFGDRPNRRVRPVLLLRTLQSRLPSRRFAFSGSARGGFRAGPSRGRAPKLRRTTRHFRPDPVEKEKIEKIILAGQYAPTGTNRQGVEYLIVQSPQALAKLREQTIEALAAWVNQSEKSAKETRGKKAATQQEQASARATSAFQGGMKKKVEAHRGGQDQLFYNAPVLILCHTDPATTLFPEWEVALANMQMLLMAEALGLGTCLNGALVHALEHSSELRAALPIPPAHVIPISFMVGYPAFKFLRTVHRRPARTTWI